MKFDSLDANLIIHYIVGDVTSQRAQVNKLLNTPDTIHRLEFIAITEIVYVLEKFYQFSRPETIDHLSFLLAQYADCVSYDHNITSEVFPLYLSHPKLSFDDCYLATLAKLNHAEPLYTFDKKLASQHPSAKLLT